jgi:hypothetical protein
MREVASDVRGVILPWGHQLAEEGPDELAAHYLEFFSEKPTAQAGVAAGQAQAGT